MRHYTLPIRKQEEFRMKAKAVTVTNLTFDGHATRKIANASGNQTVPVMSAVSAGLARLGTSAMQMSEYILAHPADLKATTESARAIGRQFSELNDRVSEFAESNERLQAATQETVKASEWIAGQFCGAGQSVSVANCGRVVGSFADL